MPITITAGRSETFIPLVSSALFPLLYFSLYTQKHAPYTTKTILGEYDYIVVGAGSGGSTVAARLTEKSCINVLLLEAGKSPPRLTEIPMLSRTFVGTGLDWRYYTAPQKHTGRLLYDRQVYFPMGKVVGGSSIWNAMLYVRGHRHIYDEWELNGAAGWGYRDILPYFKKMEMNANPESINIRYHGFKGPMTVEEPVFDLPYRSALEAAVRERGHYFNDPNGKHQKGFFKYQGTIRGGQRCSTAKAYLVPAQNRTNLHIVDNAFVTKIIIEHDRAIGVIVDHLGKTHFVRAKKEVIISAGAIKTAQLLMLSGIGPKEHLEEMGIHVIADLPVGLNLQDHAGCFHGYYSDKLTPALQTAMKPKTIAEYASKKSGILATAEGIQTMAFLTNKKHTPPDTVPDHELYFLDGVPLIAKTQTNVILEAYEQLMGPYENRSQLWCISQHLHPQSRGFVKLRSADPYDGPIIDPNYFSHPQDLRDIAEGLKECDRMVDTHAFKALDVKPFGTKMPGCEKYPRYSDEYLACEIESLIITLSHQVGTAKMGNPYDPTTVVDPELRVKGIHGLRVVDASIMPIIPTANTNVPTIMVAEKAADMIKSELYCGSYYKNHVYNVIENPYV